MFNKVISKRTSVFIALLMLAVALLVVSGNSAYATHDGGDLPLTLPFSDGFGSPPSSNDVIHWDEIEDQNDYCAVKNSGGGGMALQLSNECDAYVTFEVPYGTTLIVDYDWGYHTTGGTDDDGQLEVWVVQLERSSDDPNTLNILNTSLTYIESFQPRQAKSNTGPIYPRRVEFDFLASTTGQDTTIIQVHFKGTSTGSRDWGWVDNVNITRETPLPAYTITNSQGGFHNTSEALACEVLLEMDRAYDAGMSVEAITGITEILASPSVSVELSTEGLDNVTTRNDVRTLCLFLVGDQGASDACTFLPAGKLLDENERCKSISNLAAQDITLRLNLNLDLVYGEWGVDQDAEFRPIYLDYYLNVDPAPDPAGYMVYPLDNTFGDEALGTCGALGATVEGLCAAGVNAEMTALGMVVQNLDRAGTTVGDMLDAADTLLMAGATIETMTTINGVELTQLQVTDILSIINKSYKAGIPTGAVTAWDYD